MNSSFLTCITFDVDCYNYIEKRAVNEFDVVLPSLVNYFKVYNEIRATWFIRLDKLVEKRFGIPDYYFINYSKTIEQLKKLGHEIGWHPHFDHDTALALKEPNILNEIDYLFPFVKMHNLKITRLGGGLMTNKIMEKLNQLSFFIDSSSIPRPKYTWSNKSVDWSNGATKIYRPSKKDYKNSARVGENFKILEVPMSVALVKAPYDQIDVMRYINPSYKSKIFEYSFLNFINHQLENKNYLVTITHPYEINACTEDGLISFSLSDFDTNLNHIRNISLCNGFNSARFITISELANVVG